MTFQKRYSFLPQNKLPLLFLRISTIIGFMVIRSLANSTIPEVLNKQAIQQIEAKNSSTTLKIDISIGKKPNTINSTNRTLTIPKSIKNLNNDDEDTTFAPETILFEHSDRRYLNSMDKINATKPILRKKDSNITWYDEKPVEPLQIDPSKLPVEKNSTKLPTHKLSKNLTSINLESRMLFERDK